MHIALFEPEIPPNTGNVARLCAATRTPLHLVEPLGFSLDDKHLKRAGLDYWPHVQLRVWKDFDSFLAGAEQTARFRREPLRIVASSSRSGTPLHEFTFTRYDYILLGPETRGLPEEVLIRTPYRVRIPIWGAVRSLNLSTAAGVLLYEGLRQTGMLQEKDSHVF